MPEQSLSERMDAWDSCSKKRLLGWLGMTVSFDKAKDVKLLQRKMPHSYLVGALWELFLFLYLVDIPDGLR